MDGVDIRENCSKTATRPEDEEVHRRAPDAPRPSALAAAPQLLTGRSRACGFWVSSFVPIGIRYVVDTSVLIRDAERERWKHPAGDRIPDDCILVVIHPTDAGHILKAMSTDPMPVGPAYVAARVIDFQCKEDPTLAERLGWKMQRAKR